MKTRVLVMRLYEALHDEHETKCELLGCEGPEEGEHTEKYCRQCNLISEAMKYCEKADRRRGVKK